MSDTPREPPPRPPMPFLPEGLSTAPPKERWDEWEELDPAAWPRRERRKLRLVPTICFNCESACGLLGYVDRESGEVVRFEGNPLHPGSRGRVCAKGPATLNQVRDRDRILYPLRRSGPRGSGQFERTTWDEVLDTIGTRIGRALREDRRTEVMYHVGRPGHDGAMDRVLKAWGVDGHNSHTNVCSSGARVGYALTCGIDRPSPDYANARTVLLLSAHLESGHYFNPHAQRIIEGKQRGAVLIVMDPRLSNTAAKADLWLPTWPGSEATVLLAIAGHLFARDRIDHAFVERWCNWRETLAHLRADGGVGGSYHDFVAAFRDHLAQFSFERAAVESGVEEERLRRAADWIGEGLGGLASHVWRGPATGNLGGWQVARALQLLNVLTGSVGTVGGTSPNTWNKFVPKAFHQPPPQQVWSELLYPREYPLAYHEMSQLLPYLVTPERRIDVYFTRVFNPVWTFPDGAAWIDLLCDEERMGLHVALTPTWNETARYADYVLPMGLASERHDLMSQETHAGSWIGFRQPIARVLAERDGRPVRFTYEANPGEVWEEEELFLELSWRIDPDGALGVRRHFESPYRPGEKMRIDEHYRWIFESSVPGLPEAAAAEGLEPLEYMRRYGAFEVKRGVYGVQEGEGFRFPTPSGKVEIFSPTLVEWGWPEHAMPAACGSHVAKDALAADEMVLVPTFRLPTLIHSRSANSEWLYELSHKNPLWLHPRDAGRLGLTEQDLVRVETEIGWFVLRPFVTEGLQPGLVACSHHLGRWHERRHAHEASGWASAEVELLVDGDVWRWRRVVAEGESGGVANGGRWWRESGVHQNMTFPVHPDPISGMHCWHQKVRVRKAEPGDRFGDIVVDRAKARAVYQEWSRLARPARGPLRRPLWLSRAVRPTDEAYRLVPER
ncbi:MAG TPA: molybdopterin dinucleotide binding domain-containing protein [Thermoanaerobaculia bacterium]|nr:molybdopterin dinucleotide binding domain-containing protein [Thermoanaerobaculia bacterium]